MKLQDLSFTDLTNLSEYLKKKMEEIGDADSIGYWAYKFKRDVVQERIMGLEMGIEYGEEYIKLLSDKCREMGYI